MPTSSALKRGLLAAVPRQLVLLHGPRDRKRLALTFDDGPGELTDEYLRVLDQLDVPATFFLMGDLLEQQPHMLARYLARGHQVASHGYNHHAFPSLSFPELRRQIAQTQAVIGAQPTARPWIRPPYGELSPGTLFSLARLRTTVALWSVDSRDYSTPDPAEIVRRCTAATIRGGDVFLFHEGQARTVSALPAIVAHWRTQGYEFVTMADLVA